MSYLTLLNAVAQVVGGTQPNSTLSSVATALQPYWYSGADTTDGTGVAGLAGCFSLPTEQLNSTPVAMVLPDAWNPLQPFPTQGRKYREDLVHVRVMVGHTDLQTAFVQLVNFADLVPTAFDTHMMLFNQANVDTADCSAGSFLEVEWPVGTVYYALQFVVKVHRAIPVTYT